jgi:hypothetical protein
MFKKSVTRSTILILKSKQNVPEHLFKYVAELLAAELVCILFRLCLAAKAKGAPREAEAATASLLFPGIRSRDLFVVVEASRSRARAGTKRRAETVVASGGIVVSSSCRVGQSVVGVVDLLELSRAGGTLWRVGRHAIGVVLQRLSRLLVVSLVERALVWKRNDDFL